MLWEMFIQSHGYWTNDRKASCAIITKSVTLAHRLFVFHTTTKQNKTKSFVLITELSLYFAYTQFMFTNLFMQHLNWMYLCYLALWFFVFSFRKNVNIFAQFVFGLFYIYLVFGKSVDLIVNVLNRAIDKKYR